MDDEGYVHLDVALELGGGDIIRGSVGHGDGRRTPFSGWLELMSVFDTARAEPVAGGDAPGSDG